MPHLDEGTIHAWLDGALSAADVAATESHVRDCGECAQRVAEARGLVAGASRILSALDDVGLVTPGRKTEDGRRKTARRWLFAGPIGLAIAATLLFVVVREEGGRRRGEGAVTVAAESVAASQPPQGKLAAENQGKLVDASRNEIKSSAKGDLPAAPKPTASAPNAPPPPAKVAEPVTIATAVDSLAAAKNVASRDAERRDSARPLAQKAMDAAAPSKSAVMGGAAGAAPETPLNKKEMMMTQGRLGAMGCYSGLPNGVIMLDTTRVNAADDVRRTLRDARTSIGEWRNIGRDSVIVTLTSPARRVLRGPVTFGQLELRGLGSDTAKVTLVQVACPGS